MALASLTAMWLLLSFLAGSQALAANEFFGEFPKERTEVPGGVEPAGLATNDATDDLYEGDKSNNRVLRFNAEGVFQEAWGWGVGDGKEQYERCGPHAETEFAQCPGKENKGVAFFGEGVGEFFTPGPIAVNQTTGDVFVWSEARKGLKIQEFTSKGTPLAEFGQAGTEKCQVGQNFDHGIAADAAGNVYVVATGFHIPTHVVEFEQVTPTEHVCARELFSGQIEGAEYLSMDNAGDFYISTGSKILKFAAGNLSTPQWSIPATEAEGLAAEPVSGNVFYYAPKEKKYHVLSASNGHDLPELGFEHAPLQHQAVPAAFNPHAKLGGRPAGVYYTGEPEENVPAKVPPRGLIFAGSEKNPPEIRDEHVTTVGAGFATLAGEVNPQNANTTYHFEYGSEGPCESHSCLSTAAAHLAASSSWMPVSVTVSGLAPGTTYYFRIRAESEFGAAKLNEGAKFATFPAATGTLPDHRAYELVSPAEKHGGEVFPIDSHVTSCPIECEPGTNATDMPKVATPDGESIVYEGLPFQPTPEGGSVGVNENEYVARRTSSGWVTSFITPSRLSTGTGVGYRGFDEALTVGVVAQSNPALAPGGLEPPNEELYVQNLLKSSELRPLVTEPPLNPEGTAILKYASSTPDFSHIVFQTNAALTHATTFAPEAPVASESNPDLYEWTTEGVRLVNVPPGNGKATAGAVLGAGKLLGNTTESAPNYCGAVSSDGSSIWWSKLSNGRVFVREDGERTIAIPDSGGFLCGSADGKRVLLNDGRIFEVSGEAATETVNLTHNKGGFQGMLGASENLDRVYFVDTAELPSVKGPGNTSPTSGSDNLYVYDATSGTTWFIATLSSADNDYGRTNNGIEGAWQASPSDRKAQVTPDGRFVAFQSRAPLTGANSEPTSGPCKMESGIRKCFDVFEYDAKEQTLTCVSCNPAGRPPAGESLLSLLPPTGSTFPQPRNLTDEGRLYFNSFDALSVEDVEPGVQNVYEYEREGQGTCTAEAGCTLLISSGQTSLDAAFLSADSTGRNVFFTTRAQLLPADHDEMVDLYDAREGGGFPSESGAAECSGESCRPASPPPPASPVPGSAIFSGPGNLAPAAGVKPTTVSKPPAKCRKGTVRKHGKCLKVKRKKKKKASRSGHHASMRHATKIGGAR